MIECLILGDSIAVGTHMARPECAHYAIGGLNSWQWNRKFSHLDLSADTVIISLGSNDHVHIKTRAELEKLRSKVKAGKVVWILPAGNLKASNVDIHDIQAIVRSVAQENGDTILPIPELSQDKIHPTGRGYKELARQTK